MEKDREKVLNDLKEGKIDIIIGTHALFQEKVIFNDLGLVIIDEQHRFGVHQRLSLTSKSKDYPPDILIMSATHTHPPFEPSMPAIFFIIVFSFKIMFTL